MMSMSPLHTLLLTTLLATSPVTAVDKAVDPTLHSQLRMSPTDLDRATLLLTHDNPDPAEDSGKNWLFDYHAHPYFTSWPGGVVNAAGATFPAATGHGMTMAYILLGPCGMLPPHFHPRAANLVVAVEGETEAVMVQENGAGVVRTVLNPGKMTLFPKGSIHSMQNNGCENATLISALNSEDAGTLNLVNGLFSFPPDIVAAAFAGNAALQQAYAQLVAEIPDVGTGANVGSAECLKRCNILV